MLKKDTIHAYARGEIQPTDIANRDEKLLGTNCANVQLMSFLENGIVIRVIVKKSRLDASRLEEVREEYKKIRHYLAELVPMQAFITEKREEDGRDLVTAFCAPVSIAYDVFASDENFEFLKKELGDNSKLQDDIDMLISGYRALRDGGFFLDLYGDENLVITREGRLKYIDSFIIDMSQRKTLKPISEERFERIEALGTIKRQGELL